MRRLMRESPPANGSSSQPAPALLDWSAAALNFVGVKQGLTLTGTFTLTRPPLRTFQVYDLDKVSAPRFTGSKVKLQPAPFPLQSLGCIAIRRLCLSDCQQGQKSGRLSVTFAAESCSRRRIKLNQCRSLSLSVRTQPFGPVK